MLTRKLAYPIDSRFERSILAIVLEAESVKSRINLQLLMENFSCLSPLLECLRRVVLERPLTLTVHFDPLEKLVGELGVLVQVEAVLHEDKLHELSGELQRDRLLPEFTDG